MPRSPRMHRKVVATWLTTTTKCLDARGYKNCYILISNINTIKGPRTLQHQHGLKKKLELFLWKFSWKWKKKKLGESDLLNHCQPSILNFKWMQVIVVHFLCHRNNLYKVFCV
jgi:hypothetical protein